jgi:hypothetical protein
MMLHQKRFFSPKHSYFWGMIMEFAEGGVVTTKYKIPLKICSELWGGGGGRS